MNRSPGTLTDSAAAEIRAHLGRKHYTVRAAASFIGKHEMWLARRLNGLTVMSLDDIGLICAGLDLPLSVVLATVADVREPAA